MEWSDHFFFLVSARGREDDCEQFFRPHRAHLSTNGRKKNAAAEQLWSFQGISCIKDMQSRPCVWRAHASQSSVCDRNTPTSSPDRSRPGQLSLVCSRTLLGGLALPPRSPSSWCRAVSDLLSVNVAGLFDESLRWSTEVCEPFLCNFLCQRCNVTWDSCNLNGSAGTGRAPAAFCVWSKLWKFYILLQNNKVTIPDTLYL